MSPEILERVPPNTRAGLVAMNAGRPIADHGLAPIMERYEAGESIAQIAKSIGVTHAAIYRAILRNIPDQWQQYRSARALTQLDQAETDLEKAVDNVSVSRTREQIKMAQWVLERTCRSIYGDNLQVEHQGGQAPILNITVVQAPQIAPHNDQSAVIVDNSNSK